jgi:hypothetical protein
MKLIRCNLHPGRHIQTKLCEGVKKDSLGDRISAKLEGWLNPKQGDPNYPRCSSCSNPLITTRGKCVYCGSEDRRIKSSPEDWEGIERKK